MNRRLELQSYGDPMVIVEQALPAVPPKGVLIQINYAGVCHSDIHVWERDPRKPPLFEFPRVLGHEIAGTIMEFGEDADQKNLKVGEKVVVYPWGNCGKCNYCSSDNNLCPVTQADPTADTRGTWVFGVFSDGGFQTHMAVPATSLLVALPDVIPLETACMLPCSALTGYSAVTSVTSAVDEAIRVNGKATVAIVGAGGVGLWAIQMCKAIFPENVTICVVDITEEKLKDAKEAGADITVCWAKEPEAMMESVKSLVTACGGRIDASVDFTGFPQSVIRLVLASQTGATVSVIGLGGGDMPPIPLRLITLKGIRLQGVCTGTKTQLKTVIQLVAGGKVRPPPVTYISLDDVNETFQKLLTGAQKGRAIIKM